MRYFIAQNGPTVVEKQAFSGDNALIDALVNKYKLNHPSLTVTELDQATFDATVMTPAATPAQTIWAGLPFQTNPTAATAFQAIHALAKYLGLE